MSSSKCKYNNKRLTNEEIYWEKEFNNYNQYLGIHKINNSKENIYLYFKKLQNNSNLLFKFELNNYPWHPPKIYTLDFHTLKEKNLFIYDLKLDGLILDELKEISNITCFCCNTILCGNNWGPTLNIISIVDEIKKIYEYKQRISERLTIKNINNKFNFFIKDILKNKILPYL
tara:strand:- start:357 stop:875 length:519 start_codon:yes stop_codon:yes gene_type:complete